jgi:uncharacterized membrane protein
VQIREWVERIRHSLWFIPGLAVLAAGAAALAMLAISEALGQVDADLPIVFSAGPDGARATLQAIAGSVITVAGVVFSITIVALQLTSTQFSPRVLRNFMRDRANQLVLGTFMGTFTYCLLVLRTIRSEDELRGDAFVPNLAITGALLLAFLSLAMLIYFIHHISVRIQVTSIVGSVTRDTLGTIRHVAGWAEPDPKRGWLPVPTGPGAPPPPSGAVPTSEVAEGALLLRARESGNLQLVDLEGLVARARESGGRYRLLVSPGGWVQDRAAIAAFVPADRATFDAEEHERHFLDVLAVADERSSQQDVAFGIQQLVDIGSKALSPSVNDPTTAMACIDRLVEVLVAAGMASDPPRGFADLDGVLRLEVPFPGFDELVPLAFDQLRHYGATTPAVVIHFARGLSILLGALPDDRHPPLHAQARELAAAAGVITVEADRRRALDALEPLLG